jgi:hypothetical protein
LRRRRLSGRSRVIFLPFVRAAFRVEDHVCESESDCVSDGSGGGYSMMMVMMIAIVIGAAIAIANALLCERL